MQKKMNKTHQTESKKEKAKLKAEWKKIFEAFKEVIEPLKMFSTDVIFYRGIKISRTPKKYFMMKINRKKLEPSRLLRQEEIMQKWKDNNFRGTVEAVTGFGKTMIGLMLIDEMLDKYPDKKILVVVPSKFLKGQWLSLLESFKMSSSAEVVVINTVIKNQYNVDLLVLDETHRYGADKFREVFSVVRYKYILGLTATVERKDGNHDIILTRCPIVDTVTYKEALDKDWISSFKVFNIGVELNYSDTEALNKINKTFKYHQIILFIGILVDTKKLE